MLGAQPRARRRQATHARTPAIPPAGRTLGAAQATARPPSRVAFGDDGDGAHGALRRSRHPRRPRRRVELRKARVRTPTRLGTYSRLAVHEARASAGVVDEHPQPPIADGSADAEPSHDVLSADRPDDGDPP